MMANAPIWVVDDDRSIRWVLERALSRADLGVQTFDNASAALDALQESQPRVLLTDIRMPGLDGLSLLANVHDNHPGLVFQWLRDLGGLEGMAKINQRKAEKLYAAIDGSDFYANPVEKSCRSWMNVPFTLANADLDADFLAGAKKAGLVTLKGHRSVGGMRASIYNAMPEEGVDTLVSYMAEFSRTHG